MVRVELEACVAGNPLKAWKGTTGEDDTEHVPDDVWEHQSHEFDDLEEAKEFVLELPEQTTTHVTIFSEDEEGEFLLWEQDRDGDALDSLEDTRPVEEVPDDPNFVPEAPPLMEAQK